MMKKYYRLARIEHPDYGIAYSGDNVDFNVITERVKRNKWAPITFILKDGGFSDYQSNDNYWALCSTKLKAIIEREASPEDSMTWLPVNVVDENNQKKEYYALHMPEKPDVLDSEKSIYADDFVVKPVFSLKKIGDHRVFSYPSGESIIIVAESIRHAITSANCIGIDFLQVPISE